MAAKNHEIDLTEEVHDARTPSTLRTTLIGSTVIFWIFSVFMIHAMNSLRAELKAMREQMNALIRVTAGQSPAQYRVVDPDGKVIYTPAAGFFSTVGDPDTYDTFTYVFYTF